jgi:hypothetical protein
MVHAPTCPHEILYKSSVLWRVRPRSRFHTPASANQSRSAAPLTAAFRLTLKASWRPLLAACSVPNDPEPSWTFQRTMENFSELLTQRQPGFQGVGMRHHTDWWHIHTSGMVYVARLSQRQKLRRWQGRVVKWQKAVDWELTGKKKSKTLIQFTYSRNMSLENMSRWPQTTPSDRSQVSSAKGAARPHDSCYPSWNPKWSWSNCRIMKHEIYYIIYIYYIYYIYIIFIYIYTSLGGWCLPEIHGIPCRTAICCVLWVRVFFGKLRTYKILLFPTSRGIFALTYYGAKITFWSMS